MLPAVVLAALAVQVVLVASGSGGHRCPGCGADLADPTVACECGVGYRGTTGRRDH